MIKGLESLKNTVNKYMADIRPNQLTTCQSERKSVISRRPSVYCLEQYLVSCVVQLASSPSAYFFKKSINIMIDETEDSMLVYQTHNRKQY
jgi:hypothetical protein